MKLQIAKRCGRLAVFAVIFTACFISCYASFNFKSRPIWDGAIYHNAIMQCIDSGHRLPLETESPKSHYHGAYEQRVLYIWGMSYGHRLFRKAGLNPYFVVNLMAMFIGSLYLFMLCANILKTSILAGLAAAIAFTLFPAMLLINQVQAHPDMIACAFLASSLYHYQRGRWIVAALILMFGSLIKQTVGFMYVYFILDIIQSSLKMAPSKIKYAAILFMFACLGVSLCLIRQFSPPVFFDKSIVLFVWEHNYSKMYLSLLFNFGVLTLPCLIGLYLFCKDSPMPFLVYTLLGLAAAIPVATDMFRVFFTMMFPFALPAAWAYLDRLFKTVGAERMLFIVSTTILLLLLPSKSTYDEGMLAQINITGHIVIITFMLIGEILSWYKSHEEARINEY